MTRHTRQPGGPRRPTARSKGTRGRGVFRSTTQTARQRATVEIEHVGREGDGLGREVGAPDGSRGKTVAIPFTLPGERVDAQLVGERGRALRIEQPAGARREPLCTHHGRASEVDPACGACALQHWTPEPYRAWKRELLVRALQRAGIDAEVDPLVASEPGTRRRLVLAARRTEAGVVLGFNAHRTDRIVDMRECPVALPVIVDALPALRDLLREALAPGARAKVSVLATETGLDVAIEGDGVAEVVAARFGQGSIVRVSANGEVLHERAAPVLRFGATAITPPPGAFVQAVAMAEDAMASLVCEHLRGARRVADLFCGSGAFALRLAQRSAVHAVETFAAPLAALDRAWRGGEGLRTVTIERRDLERRPLQPAELEGRDGPRSKPYDGLVFDPPRAGAEAQCEALARAHVPRVAAVSCNPQTLARDLAILVGGGYRIERLVPIDQFLFTPHLEVVALLSRD